MGEPSGTGNTNKQGPLMLHFANPRAMAVLTVRDQETDAAGYYDVVERSSDLRG